MVVLEDSRFTLRVTSNKRRVVYFNGFMFYTLPIIFGGEVDVIEI